MTSVYTKTPVSMLQEHTIAQNLSVPIYKVIKNGDGTHNPEFVFQVEVGSLCESGSGKSKREAKHRAAKNMLKHFNLVMDEIENDHNSCELSENYVGELKQYCLDNHYPEVKYYDEEDAGPPHCKIFKIACCVSQLVSHGIDKTKKHAKQRAAFSMLERLKKLEEEKLNDVTDSCSLEVPKSKIIHVPEVKLTDEEVIEKLKTIRSLGEVEEKDPAAYYKDYQKAYLKLPEKSATLSQLLKSNNIKIEDSLKDVIEIAKELEVSLSCAIVPTKEGENNFTILQMTTVPPLAALGMTEPNAAFNLLHSLADLCSP